MKVLVITSAFLLAAANAAAIPSTGDSQLVDKREASAAADPAWWNFKYNRNRLHARDALPEAAADPAWWNFKYNRGRHDAKRDAMPEAVAEPFNYNRAHLHARDALPEASADPAWWNFKYNRGRHDAKRDVEDAFELPEGMTPEDFEALFGDVEAEPVEDKKVADVKA